MEPSNSNSQKKEEDSAIPDHILANLAEYLLKLNSALKEAPLSPDVSDGLLALSLSSPNNAPQSQNGIQHADTNNVANATTTNPIKVELDFLDVFSDPYTSLADYLDKINFEASQAGYKYNRGPTDLTRGYYSIYCKYKPRRLPKENETNASKTRKKNPCEVYYRLRLVGRELKLVAFEQSHNHEGTDFSDITESMKLDLKLICRTRNILDIIDYLESKYRCNGLNYYKVYYQFRKIQPLFRERDCATFVSFLHLKSCFTKYVLTDEDENLCKLFFATPQMISNYSLYGDIALADTTYQVNRYKIPLLIFTGVATNGKNVVFGMACINDETYETYKWALEAFFECHKKVYPKTIVTDGDLALCGAADDYKNQSVHLVCQWHMNRNITRRFAFLKKINMDLYTLVIGLSHEKDQDQAENHFNKLEEFLKTSKAYDKSLKYLQKIWAYKQKWVDPYMPQIFTGGVTTTSRTEAMNALVKRYTTKTSEISAMIELITDLDASFAFNDPNSLKEKKPIDSKIPMLQGLQENLGDIIYKKHYEEYLLSHQYLWFGLPDEVDTYQITYDGHLQEPELHSRKVVWKDNQIVCSCNFYPTTGIICRHLFVIARKNQAVDLAKFIHPRWKINRNEGEMQIETPFFEKKEVDTIRREEKARMAKEDQEMESVLDFTRILNAKKKRGQKPKMKHPEVEVSDYSQEDDDEGEEEHKTSDVEESNGQSPKSASGKKKKVLKNFKPLVKTKGRPSKTDSKKRKERETDELSDLYQAKKPFKK